MRKLVLVLVALILCVHNYAQEIAVQKENVFKGITKVSIDADFCALKMSGHNSSDINFSGVVKSEENLEAYKIETKTLDGVLSIRVIKPSVWKSHWGEIILQLPEGLAIEVTTQSGKVVASDLKVINLTVVSKSGHVTLTSFVGSASTNSPAGDLSVNNLTGNLKGRTKTGAISIKTIKGNCDLACHKGIINISDVKGKLYVDGGSGNQEVENIEGDITLKSTSGDVKLSIAKGNMVCKTFDGDMKLFNTNGTYAVQSSTGSIVGTRVEFVSSSSFTSTEGNIKMQIGTKKDLAFLLKSNNSFLRAMGKSKKKSLKIGKGNILITGTSTTGAQAYY